MQHKIHMKAAFYGFFRDPHSETIAQCGYSLSRNARKSCQRRIFAECTSSSSLTSFSAISTRKPSAPISSQKTHDILDCLTGRECGGRLRRHHPRTIALSVTVIQCGLMRKIIDDRRAVAIGNHAQIGTAFGQYPGTVRPNIAVGKLFRSGNINFLNHGWSMDVCPATRSISTWILRLCAASKKRFASSFVP